MMRKKYLKIMGWNYETRGFCAVAKSSTDTISFCFADNYFAFCTGELEFDRDGKIVFNGSYLEVSSYEIKELENKINFVSNKYGFDAKIFRNLCYGAHKSKKKTTLVNFKKN